MKKLYIPFSILMLATAASCGGGSAKGLPEGLYAIIDTPKGEITLQLYYDRAPLTVTNFVGLADGAFAKNIERKGKFYDGLVFHRVIAEFVVQGGDPAGNGTGGPGYTFFDEIDPALTFDAKGVLAMANSGADTNGSQFFITLGPAEWLNGRHTIFGTVVKNMEAVEQIAESDAIKSISIAANGKAAKDFLKSVSWKSFEDMRAAVESTKASESAAARTATEALITAENPPLTKSPEGIYYIVQKAGTGEPPKSGDTVTAHYTLRLYGSKEIIDSSASRNEPISIVAGAGQVIKGWDIVLLQMKKGEKRRVVLPPDLGYGATAVGGGIIPANSFLDFEIEITDIARQ